MIGVHTCDPDLVELHWKIRSLKVQRHKLENRSSSQSLALWLVFMKCEDYETGIQIIKVKVMYLAPRVPENLGHEVWGVRSGTLVKNQWIFSTKYLAMHQFKSYDYFSVFVTIVFLKYSEVHWIWHFPWFHPYWLFLWLFNNCSGSQIPYCHKLVKSLLFDGESSSQQVLWNLVL